MTAALPHTGGAYSFGRSAMGPWGGFVTGLAENMEYVLTPAVVVFFTGSYLGAIFGTPECVRSRSGGCWATSCSSGSTSGASRRLSASRCSSRCSRSRRLAVLWVGALPLSTSRTCVNIAGRPRATAAWLPVRRRGHSVRAAVRDLVLSRDRAAAARGGGGAPAGPRPAQGHPARPADARRLRFPHPVPQRRHRARRERARQASGEPVLDGYRTIFGEGVGAKVLGLVAVAGLIASFHTIIFAYGRNIYSLSRAGYLPRWLSVTHPIRKTPYVALIAGGVLGYLVLLVLHLARQGGAGRRDGAQHGGLGRGDRLLHADRSRSSCCGASGPNGAALRQRAGPARRLGSRSSSRCSPSSSCSSIPTIGRRSGGARSGSLQGSPTSPCTPAFAWCARQRKSSP